MMEGSLCLFQALIMAALKGGCASKVETRRRKRPRCPARVGRFSGRPISCVELIETGSMQSVHHLFSATPSYELFLFLLARFNAFCY